MLTTFWTFYECHIVANGSVARSESLVEQMFARGVPPCPSATAENNMALQKRACLRAFNFLVVAALAPVLRGQPGRNPGDNDDTTRHLSGRSVRVLAFGLAFMPLASRMTTRERAAGKMPLSGAGGGGIGPCLQNK